MYATTILAVLSGLAALGTALPGNRLALTQAGFSVARNRTERHSCIPGCSTCCIDKDCGGCHPSTMMCCKLNVYRDANGTKHYEFEGDEVAMVPRWAEVRV